MFYIHKNHSLAINQKVIDNSNKVMRDLYINQLLDEADRNIAALNETKESAIDTQANMDTIIKLLLVKNFESPKILSKLDNTFKVLTSQPSTITFENITGSRYVTIGQIKDACTRSIASLEELKLALANEK